MYVKNLPLGTRDTIVVKWVGGELTVERKREFVWLQLINMYLKNLPSGGTA